MSRIALLCCLYVSTFAFGGEILIGTLTSTGTAVVNNTLTGHTATAVPFVVPRDAKISVQCDAASYIVIGNAALAVATATNSVKLLTDVLFLSSTPPGGTGETVMYMSMISASGTANCRVFTRRGNEG